MYFLSSSRLEKPPIINSVVAVSLLNLIVGGVVLVLGEFLKCLRAGLFLHNHQLLKMKRAVNAISRGHRRKGGDIEKEKQKLKGN